MTGTQARSVVLMAVALVICAWWATELEAFSTGATLVVLGAGAVSMAVAGARRVAKRTPDVPLRATVPWLVLFGALMTIQLAAYRQHPRSDHPTLSSLANSALEPRPIRVLAFAAWMVAAGWLARR